MHARRLFLFILPLMLACATTDTQPSRSEGELVQLDEGLRRALVSFGLPVERSRLRGSEVIVDGDISVRLSVLRNRAEELSASWSDTTKAQVTTSPSLLPMVARPASLRISTNQLAQSQEWLTATRQAIAYYNATTGVGVVLVETEDAPNLVVRVEALGFGTTDTYAMADFPDGVRFGEVVRINSDYAGTTPTADQRLYIMVHEIGHVLGLRHTDWSLRGEPAAEFGFSPVPGTPTSDAASVMNSVVMAGEFGSTWNGWSFFDLVALRTVHPVVEPAAVSYSNVSGSARLSWNAQPGVSDYVIIPYKVVSYFGAKVLQAQYASTYPTTSYFSTSATSYSARPGGFPNNYGSFRGKLPLNTQNLSVGWTCFTVRNRYPGGALSFGEALGTAPPTRLAGCFS